MPKKAVSFVFRSKYKRVISIVISVGFFVIYVAFYATLEEREPRELEVPEIAGKVQSMAANVTEVLLFPPNVPPVFTHQIPDYSQKRDGPGENGQGVLLKGIEHSEGESSMKQWFMNVVAR